MAPRGSKLHCPPVPVRPRVPRLYAYGRGSFSQPHLGVLDVGRWRVAAVVVCEEGRECGRQDEGLVRTEAVAVAREGRADREACGDDEVVVVDEVQRDVECPTAVERERRAAGQVGEEHDLLAESSEEKRETSSTKLRIAVNRS